MAYNSTLDDLPDLYWKYVFGVLMSIVSALATVENALVVVIICKFTSLQTPSNKILASLALADFFIGLVVTPIHSVQLFSDKLINNIALDVTRRYLSMVFIGASSFTLGFISLDRSLHLVNLQNYKMPNIALYPSLILCWMLPIIFPLLWKIGEAEQIYSAFILLIWFLALAVIIISFVGLTYSLEKNAETKDDAIMRSYKRKERRAGITVLIIITVHTLLLIPTFIHQGLHSMAQCTDSFLARAQIIAIFLKVINSVVNPIIYYYRTPPLRKYFRQLFLPQHAFKGLSNSIHSTTESTLVIDEVKLQPLRACV